MRTFETQAVKGIEVDGVVTLKDKAELHGMSDTSNVGYGAVAYVKMFTTDQNEAQVAMLTSKSCVTPLNQVASGIHGSIPRLELTAAVVLADMIAFICKEMKVKFTRRILWTDSSVSLYQIKNRITRQKAFVAEYQKYMS